MINSSTIGFLHEIALRLLTCIGSSQVTGLETQTLQVKSERQVRLKMQVLWRTGLLPIFVASHGQYSGLVSKGLLTGTYRCLASKVLGPSARGFARTKCAIIQVLQFTRS